MVVVLGALVTAPLDGVLATGASVAAYVLAAAVATWLAYLDGAWAVRQSLRV